MLHRKGTLAAVLILGGIAFVFVYFSFFSTDFLVSYDRTEASANPATSTKPIAATVQPLNIALYNQKLLQLAHRSATSTVSTSSPQATSTKKYLWPAKTVYPLAGALLPFNRIVAYYGNFYSTAMGVLGEYPPDEVLQKLQAQAAVWQAADPTTPVIPAIDYIAVTAQGSPGADGKYRLRMPDSQIQKALDMAGQVHGILILDVQVGLSNVQTEVPLLQKWLAMPNVELALDPEFAMQTSGRPPGTVIGTLDASDINWAANFLAQLVQQNNLPPKILVVHRFTEDMVTNTQNIKPLPQVEIVMDMDGWGFPAKKINTYNDVIYPYPVQFTGLKLFYKADLTPPSTRLLTPQEILDLTPSPSFIQYQ